MTDSSRDELRSHLVTDAIRRHLWLVILPALILAPLGFLLGEARQDSYQSTIRVLLRPLPGNPFAPDAANTSQQQTVVLTTESLVAVSAPVIDKANPKLNPPIAVGDNTLSSSVPTNSQVVQLLFRAGSPEAAQNGANVVAKAFLDYRAEIAAATQKARIDALTAQQGEIRPKLDAASKAASAAVPAPEAAQQVQLYATQLSDVEKSIQDAKAVPLAPGEVIQAASVPEAPVGLGSLLIAAIGGLVGLGIGFLLALWRERAAYRLAPGVQVVAGVPVVASRPSEKVARDLRGDLAPQLRDAVLSAVTLPAVVSVTSVGKQAQGAAVATAIAECINASGAGVVLVEGVGSGSARPGLADLLREDTTDLEGLLVDGPGGVRVLPAGTGAGAAQDLMSGPRMAYVVSQLREAFDVVVIDAPEASAPSALGASRAADAVVLVATEHQDTHDAVKRVVERANLLSVAVLGVALVPQRLENHRAAPAASRAETPAQGSGPGRDSGAPAPAEPVAAVSSGTNSVGAERGPDA